MTFSVPTPGTKAVTQAKKGTRNKPVIKLFCYLCICDSIFLADIRKYMPPDVAFSKADYQRAKARCESEMNRVQEKIAAIKQRQTLNTDTQTLKPDIRAAITGIVSGRTADDDFYGHLLQQMTVYRDGRVEVALNLLPAKWVYVLDGLEKYRAKIGGHDASSVPMSVSRPLSSG